MKKNIFLSLIAITMAVSMLAGGTYSWFTASDDFGAYKFETAEDFKDNNANDGVDGEDNDTTSMHYEEEDTESEDSEPQPVYFQVSSLKASPDPVELGETLTVTFDLENTGDEEGARQVVLQWNDGYSELIEKSKEVTLKAGAVREGLDFSLQVPEDTIAEASRVTVSTGDHQESTGVELEPGECNEENSDQD